MHGVLVAPKQLSRRYLLIPSANNILTPSLSAGFSILLFTFVLKSVADIGFTKYNTLVTISAE
jgi:hypothetical protein